MYFCYILVNLLDDFVNLIRRQVTRRNTAENVLTFIIIVLSRPKFARAMPIDNLNSNQKSGAPTKRRKLKYMKETKRKIFHVIRFLCLCCCFDFARNKDTSIDLQQIGKICDSTSSRFLFD